MKLTGIRRRFRRLARHVPSLHELPQPLHLFEYVTGSQHYHFGYFATPQTSLREAMDDMARRALAYFGKRARVVDVGCALGGTSRLLAEGGLDVVGIDPCLAAIEYARTRATNGTGFFRGRLESFRPRPGTAPLDGMILIEVLQHFSSLEELFAECRSLLRPGGLVVVDDVVKSPDEELNGVPYHRRGALLRAAGAAGFEVVHDEDLTPRTAPTLARLVEALVGRRDEMERFFAPERPSIGNELDELLVQVRLLERGFAGGHLGYESIVLRRPASEAT